VANSLGVYTGIVNAASHTVGTSTIANSLGVYTGIVNGSSISVGTSTIANSTGVYTGIVNASSISVGTYFIANGSQITITPGIPITGTSYLTLSSTSGYLAFNTNGSERVRISSSGGFSVGTTADAGGGSIYATGNITAYYSDDRLKTRLGPIENALDKVSSLDTFYYEPNDLAQSLGYKPVREVGLSAQQVQVVMPEVVALAPIDEQYLTVRYERLMALAFAAIKELKAEIETLKKGA
jgi:hypothetical protein